MALTGFFIIFYLLMHMFGNTKLLMPDGAHSFDLYAESLRAFLYPILPKLFFLTIFRIVLGFSVIVHIIAAVRLTFRDWDARGGLGRYVRQRYQAGSFAARTMIWGGIIIALGLALHLAQFTNQWIKVGYTDTATLPSDRVLIGFSEWWLVALYALWMLAVCLHVWHGFYSAFCTIGARVGAFSEKVIKACAWVVAILLYVGFMITPVAIALGLVGA